MIKILVIEHEDKYLQPLKTLLETQGFVVSHARSVEEAQTGFRFPHFSLIISELNLPKTAGTHLIQQAAPVPVLITGSNPALEMVVESMRLGAADFIPKPFDQHSLLTAVNRVLQSSSSGEARTNTCTRTCTTNTMIGSCSAMKQVFDIIHKVAMTDATVLIHGETGTGKELAASAIHNESQRVTRPLICVNCAAIPETLIEAELFGHEKGAFTGATEARKGLVAAADGGTLFLDEVGELPLEAQARLLRVLQEKEVRPIGSVKSRKVDIRLVAATHRNLKKLCEEGLFREDLFYRINVVNLDLPPLRDRGNDILDIANALLQKQCAKLNKHHLSLGPDAIQAIITYGWPGNIRELENSLERATILCDDQGQISHDLLGISLSLITMDEPSGNHPQTSATKQMKADPPEGLSLEDYFTQFVLANQEAMSETELARKLGISRKCLWERRNKLGIPRKKSGTQ
jgi:two-component system response regulator HydG